MKAVPVVTVAAVLACAFVVVSQQQPVRWTGPQADGSVLLNSGWSLRPAGRQIPLSTLPMASVLTPNGKHLLVLHGGYRKPTVAVLDARTLAEVSKLELPDAWLGLALSPNGRNVYAGGGSTASVYEMALSEEGRLTRTRTIPLTAEAERMHQDFTGDVAVSADGRLLYAAMVHRDRIAVVNLSSGVVIEKFQTGRRPYRILLDPKGSAVYVSSWADSSVVIHKPETGEISARVATGPHPTDMVWRDRQKAQEDEEQKLRGRIFVTAANTNSVFVLGVTDDNRVSRVESINVSLYPDQPAGMTPSALALDSQNNRLYIVCSDANAAAAVDISTSRSRVLGFIPAGWYPVAARVLPDSQLAIFNGRGGRSFSNPDGPQPDRKAAVSHEGLPNPGYVGNLQVGSATLLNLPSESDLTRYTATVRTNSAYKNGMADAPAAISDVVPGSRARKSPIEHVIYVVKENRTYDQMMGDMATGNGDASLTLFGEDVAPNHRKLAREFVQLDNFYVSADVSADGHNWSTSAIANDYVQKMWPNSYAGRRKHYDYEGGEAAALPPAGYIWTNAAAAGISMRNYGWWATNIEKAQPTGSAQIKDVRDPVLAKLTNMNFRSFDMDYPDVDRIKVFLEDLKQFEREGQMPRLMFVRIGNDHTSGTAAGAITPKGAVADNDMALGMLVEAVSKSRFWAKTAIFVLEDDAQNGPDHVDSHRSPGFVVSPYSRGRGLVSVHYNTTSMLRTMELILGLKPMTHFDAAAMPMVACFNATPDLTPYSAVTPKQSLTERNPGTAPGAKKSAAMDFREADRIDDDELNEVLWRAIKGTEPPAPRRSYFGRE
jgi:DNA-binding beta-propeller fold protein YncE